LFIGYNLIIQLHVLW